MSYKKRSNQPKGFKFNIYWIYGIIAAVFIVNAISNINPTQKKNI